MSTCKASLEGKSPFSPGNRMGVARFTEIPLLPAFSDFTGNCAAETSALSSCVCACVLNYFFWVIKSCLIWLIPYLFNNGFHPESQVQELGGRVAISLIEISLAPVILVQACSRKQT